MLGRVVWNYPFRRCSPHAADSVGSKAGVLLRMVIFWQQRTEHDGREVVAVRTDAIMRKVLGNEFVVRALLLVLRFRDRAGGEVRPGLLCPVVVLLDEEIVDRRSK